MLVGKNRKEEILCQLDRAGYIFPGYEIVKLNNQPKLLGAGGFSGVYEIRCIERPECRYALKVMGFEKHMITSESFKNTVSLQRFLSEQTGYICRVIDAKEIRIVLDQEGDLTEVTAVNGERWDEDGIHLQLILMEQLEDIIKKDRFGKIELLRQELGNESEVVEFALQIGQALYQAHSRDILHRDVKLENVFWNSRSGCYQLGDFGIAKYAAGGNAETVVYTDGYGAPEIERHLYESYRATADIYSFGITLYLLLNEFRFPGSEGYYVNAVQYSPEFVFPAPVHASEEMARIIRKMCQYDQEDRYQSMADVLMDLSAIKDKGGEADQTEDVQLPEIETQTYREERIGDDKQSGVRHKELTGRAKHKEEEEIYDELYRESGVRHLIGITILLMLIMGSMQTDTGVVYTWQFWIFPFMLLIESVLLSVREFHISFGAITLVAGICLGIENGITVPGIIMMLGLVTGIPIVTGACAASAIIWGVLVATEKIRWLDFIGKHDLSWILIVIVLFMSYHYLLLRIDYHKTSPVRAQIDVFIYDKIYLIMVVTGIVLLILEMCDVIRIPEIIQKIHLIRTGMLSFVIMMGYMAWNGYIDRGNGEQADENEMDNRGNGERPKTIE